MEEDQYGIADLRHFIAGRSIFPAISQSQTLSAFPLSQPYDMLMFRPDSLNATSTTTANPTAAASTSGAGFLITAPSGGGDAANGRWPRQETLTLLEIRSKLDSKFKETNQKGPLWDEVSRIMSEEHGYQRSGKKCREKFQNLYKYYKKTKEGKAGRQDGKHYRFFRQLEALYGESNISGSASESQHASGSFHYSHRKKATNQQRYPDDEKLSETSLSLSDFSDNPDDNSSDDRAKSENGDSDNRNRGIRRSWKLKIRDFIDSHMKKLIDKQEAWMDKMMRAIEDKDKERTLREEGWRKQDAARIELRQQLWARERAWMKARDTALMDALHKIAGETAPTNSTKADFWSEVEVSKLIQLRKSVEMQRGVSEEMAWKEVSSKMTCFGYERSPLACKEKWESVNNYMVQNKTENYFDPFSDQGGGGGGGVYLGNEQGIIRNSSPNRIIGGGLSNDNLLRYFMGDGNGRIGD